MEQAELLGYVAEVLQRLNVDYAVVGSFASAAWGEPRFTQDIDIVVQITHEQVDVLLAAFPDSEFYVSNSAAHEGVRLGRPFNVIHFSSGNKIDFMVVGDTGWPHAQIKRRRPLELLPGTLCHVAAPEDVIIGKLIYYREGGSDKHLRDIAGILRCSNTTVDRTYIEQWAMTYQVDDIWKLILDQLDAS